MFFFLNYLIEKCFIDSLKKYEFFIDINFLGNKTPQNACSCRTNNKIKNSPTPHKKGTD